MSQFLVYRSTGVSTRQVPYWLDIQSTLLSSLASRVIVPLFLPSAVKGKTSTTLTPTLRVEGKNVVMMTPEMASVLVHQLGPLVDDLESCRFEIVAALDFLISGI